MRQAEYRPFAYAPGTERSVSSVRVNERQMVGPAPLRRDSEERRWYDDQAASCVMLTRRGRLLEPIPTIGPTRYRLLACKVTFAEARAYAAARDSGTYAHSGVPGDSPAPDRLGSRLP